MSSVKVDDLAVPKQVTLMFMIASFASGALAFLLAVSVRDSSFVTFSAPGFIIGAFFAYKYAVYDKHKARQEEHRRRRNKH